MSEGYFGEVDQANFSGLPTDTLGLQDLMEIKKQIGGISAHMCALSNAKRTFRKAL